MYVKSPPPAREQLEPKYSDLVESWERVLFEIHRRIRSELAALDVRATVKYRVKSFASYYKKITQRAPMVEVGSEIEITDVLGVRIVCPFMEDLELVEQLLHKQYPLIEREKKGAEFSFKEFGYESVHFLSRLPDEIRDSFHLAKGTVVEIQLRTILQDAWAEVEHELVYKSEYSTFDEPLRRKLAALNANLSLADIIFHEIRVFQRELQRQIRRRREAFVEGLGSLNGVPAQDGCDDRAEDLIEILPAGDSNDNLLLRALYSHNRHDYQTAIELYTRIIEENGRTQVVHIALIHRGMAFFSLGQYELAHEDFDFAIDKGADLKRAYHYRGISFGRQGKDEQALKDFSESLTLDPNQFDVLLSRSQTYFRVGQMQESLADCDAAIKMNPESSQAKRFHDHILSHMGM